MAPPQPARSVLDRAAAALAAAGIESARLEARVLLAHALACDPADLILHPELPVPARAQRRLERLVRRRCAREPLQYLLGWAEFYSRRFRVSPAVLIPRPETELLVELVLEHCRRRPAAEWDLADLGTGSGAIAVTLAAELPGSRVWATDVSARALAVASANARAHGVADRVFLRRGHWGEPLLAEGLGGRLLAVAANPPYVAEDEEPCLPPEVRAEPRRAVVARGHPLAAYRALMPHAVRLLRPGGILVLEVPPQRAAEVREHVAAAGAWAGVEVRCDYARRPRAVLAVRREEWVP